MLDWLNSRGVVCGWGVANDGKGLITLFFCVDSCNQTKQSKPRHANNCLKWRLCCNFGWMVYIVVACKTNQLIRSACRIYVFHFHNKSNHRDTNASVIVIRTCVPKKEVG